MDNSSSLNQSLFATSESSIPSQTTYSSLSDDSGGFMNTLKNVNMTTWLIIILILAFLGFNDTKIKNIIEISINMNPQFRGKKLSVPIIQETIEYIKNNYPNIQKINAFIKYFNAPSLQCFKKSDFE